MTALAAALVIVAMLAWNVAREWIDLKAREFEATQPIATPDDLAARVEALEAKVNPISIALGVKTEAKWGA